MIRVYNWLREFHLKLDKQTSHSCVCSTLIVEFDPQAFRSRDARFPTMRNKYLLREEKKPASICRYDEYIKDDKMSMRARRKFDRCFRFTIYVINKLCLTKAQLITYLPYKFTFQYTPRNCKKRTNLIDLIKFYWRGP